MSRSLVTCHLEGMVSTDFEGLPGGHLGQSPGRGSLAPIAAVGKQPPSTRPQQYHLFPFVLLVAAADTGVDILLGSLLRLLSHE